MSQWDNAPAYKKTVELLAHTHCETIGIDTANLQLEYPLQVLLRERKPGTVFIHAGVENVSKRYQQPSSASPCAVVCLDCAGDAKRMQLYSGFRNSVLLDKFVIFGPE